jgi:hypothetical protein
MVPGRERGVEGEGRPAAAVNRGAEAHSQVQGSARRGGREEGWHGGAGARGRRRRITTGRTSAIASSRRTTFGWSTACSACASRSAAAAAAPPPPPCPGRRKTRLTARCWPVARSRARTTCVCVREADGGDAGAADWVHGRACDPTGGVSASSGMNQEDAAPRQRRRAPAHASAGSAPAWHLAIHPLRLRLNAPREQRVSRSPGAVARNYWIVP